MEGLQAQLAIAVQHFWQVRERQQESQGVSSGTRDHGNRTAVTGGKQLDGFTHLVQSLLMEAGVHDGEIFTRRGSTIVPGFFRPTKQWDLLVVSQGQLIATVEFKSIVGSFGNNMNNRTEEALGNAVDLLAAYREGKFAPAPAPWLGYLMLMEDCEASARPVEVSEPHFSVFDGWKGASYATRCEMLCQKLIRERMYQAACFILSSRETGPLGDYREPSEELCFRNFAASLVAHCAALGRPWRRSLSWPGWKRD